MFKQRSDAVRIGQDSLLIPAKNGASFSQDNILRFEVERNVGFADFANSYLEANIEIGVGQPDTMPCLGFDPLAGANNIISRLTIRSNGVVLEELAGYDLYANLHYAATDSEGNSNKRSVLEGCAKSLLIQDNPFVAQNSAITTAAIPNGATGLTTGGAAGN